MEKIYSFNGKKEVNILSKEDYKRVESELIDNDFRKIPILTKADFRAAVENNCKIYCKTFQDDKFGYLVERYFIRINRSKLFFNAEK